MMFRPMRRARQAMDRARCEEVLRRGSSGVLAVLGDGGYPYAVPLSYVYDQGKIYFHCARAGHKLEALQRCDRASFCVVDQDQVVAAAYTTLYRSVIAFGRVRVLAEAEEKRRAIRRLAEKYAPGESPESREAAIEGDWAGLCMLEMTVEHLSGKEGRELIQAREGASGQL